MQSAAEVIYLGGVSGDTALPKIGEVCLALVLGHRERFANLTRNCFRSIRAVGRLPTASRRSLPDFVIVGAQRGGTTSLYRRLAEHPNVVAPLGKELQFLTVHFDRGLRWYRAHFPVTDAGEQTFEASPYYLFHPLAANRAAEVLPDAKFVVMLRDPVARAYSHYMHSRNLGFETLSFEDALGAEDDRLAMANRLGLNTAAGMRLHRHSSYVHRGLYLHQLERWFSAVPPNSIKVIKSEDFFQYPAPVYGDLLAFLQLPDFVPDQFSKSKPATRDTEPMSEVTRSRLRHLFADDSEQVHQLLGWRNTWSLDKCPPSLG